MFILIIEDLTLCEVVFLGQPVGLWRFWVLTAIVSLHKLSLLSVGYLLVTGLSFVPLGEFIIFFNITIFSKYFV